MTTILMMKMRMTLLLKRRHLCVLGGGRKEASIAHLGVGGGHHLDHNHYLDHNHHLDHDHHVVIVIMLVMKISKK